MIFGGARYGPKEKRAGFQEGEMGRRPANVRSSRSTKEGEGMWHRLALMAAIMHLRKPLYITQMSDFLKVFNLSAFQLLGFANRSLAKC